MKKILSFVFMFLFSILFLSGCSNDSKDVLRIHIRANSNCDFDQEVKLKVRDKVVEYITPLIANCEDFLEVKNTLNLSLNSIEKIADNELKLNGFNYTSNAKICNEFFPSRKYGDKIFKADFYDALILNLGEGAGDNWWCVAYPPLCFVGEDSENFVTYKSKILELINKYFGV